jgi:signal transduction histidine kinase
VWAYNDITHIVLFIKLYCADQKPNEESIMNDQTESYTRPQGKWLLRARLAWVAIAMLATVMHIVAMPVAFNLLRTPCYQAPCDTPFQTPSEMEKALQEEVDLKGAWQSSLWEATVVLLTLGVALLIFWRRSDDWMAHLASIMLVTIIAALSPWPAMLADTQQLWRWPRAVLWAIGLASSVGLFYLFPDGRFVPRWTRSLAIAFVVIIGALAAAGAPFMLGLFIFVVVLVTGTGFQIYRYRRVSNTLQRQQTKWVVLGIIGMVLPMLVALLVAFINPSLNPLLSSGSRSPQAAAIFSMMVNFGWVIPICFLPVTLAFLILRYRLWDVDIFINRALVYGTLTAGVVTLYVLIVGWLSIGLQTNNLPASVFAILVIAFLFRPLRQHLQRLVDHFIPLPQSALPTEQHKYQIAIPESQSAVDTRFRGRWLLIARLAWAAVFLILSAMYLFGFIAVHDTLSTVCEDTLCTLRQQVRRIDAGEKVENYPGPPIGSADRLRRDQVEALETLGITPDQYGWLGALQMGIPALLYLLFAGGLFWQKSDNWMVLFVSMTVALFPLQNMPLPFTLAVRQPAWEWVVDLSGMLALSCFLILPLIFPNGRFVPHWTRWMVLFELAGAVITMLFRNSISGNSSATNLVVVYLLISLGTGVYAQLYRYFRVASPLERQQIKWGIVGLAGFVITSMVVLIPLDTLLASRAAMVNPVQALVLSAILDSLFWVVSFFIPVSIVISVLRYRLWDVDILINRTLVYGTLTGIVVSAFVIIVGLLSLLFQSSGNTIVAIIATGLVALLFNPLRQRLQRGVNHLMYGERDDPYVMLSRLGRRLEMTLVPGSVLPTVVTTVRECLKLPYAAIYLKEDDNHYKIVAESASPALHVEAGRIRVPGIEHEGRCIPLIHQGETVGYIVLGPRAPHEAFSATDLRLLEDLAPQVGVAVHAVRLTADLQRSREQLVLAREEERRRLRRDLHDDLAPTLASLGLTASTVADLIPTNPETATALVKELQTEIRATVGNIRRLVYDLRPPTLDELGLLAAVRERAAQYTNAPGGVHITVDAPAELPALPAAVEVAAYRIVQEALENVSKHSQAHQCAIRFANHNGLEIEITDDGIGLPASITPGVGLRSMRERAEELGGSCVIERCVTGGMRILACLPNGEFDGSVARSDRG